MSSTTESPLPNEDVAQADDASTDRNIMLHIPHDLAVQIIGSDAGKARRFRPHGSMTKDVPTAEVEAVARFMQPFLEREIDRVHNRSPHKVRGYAGTASPEQAQALKWFCHQFAASLRVHLDKHPDDDRMHRTRQRLDQALDVIRQINSGLGLHHEDVVPLEVHWRETLSNLKRLHHDLQQLAERIEQPEGVLAFTVKEAVLELLPSLETVLAQTSSLDRLGTRIA